MTLYHYCPTETFFKILESKELWFSDITKSNDSSEIAHAMRILKDYLSKKDCKIDPYGSNKLYFNEIKKASSHYRYYCCSLAEDGDLLSQWRGYAPNGGVSLGFDLEGLQTYVSSIKVAGEKPAITSKVYYKEIEFISEVLERIDFSKKYSGEYAFIQETVPFFKNESFSEEKEWRMAIGNYLNEKYGPVPEVSCYGDTLDYLDNDQPHNCPLKYRNGKDGKSLIFYYALPFPVQALSSVVIGPKCNLAEHEIMTLLALHFPKAYTLCSSFTAMDIKKSAIPFQ